MTYDDYSQDVIMEDVYDEQVVSEITSELSKTRESTRQTRQNQPFDVRQAPDKETLSNL